VQTCVVRAVLAFAVLCAGLASHAASAQNELFVGNAGNNSVTVYSRTATGNTAPVRTLVGAATGLSFIQGLAVDVAHNELFVANGSGPAIKVYSLTASGNTAPLRTITGAATGMVQPVYIAFDTANNELFVTNGNQTIAVYDRLANGNALPLRTLSTVPAGNVPIGLALDLTNNELIVGTSGSTIDVYSRSASGNDARLRTLGGAATGLSGPIGLGIDTTHNELFSANLSVASPSVTVYGRTDSGNTAPLRTLSGALTGLVGPHALTLDLTNNELFVANTINANTITVYPRGASGNTAASRTLGGALTGISGPVAVAVTQAAIVATLDVDASVTATKYDALTDGLLILRYLFGLTGTALTDSVVGGTATRTDPAVLKTYLDGIRAQLDIDGNGQTNALTDGLLILRYLFGVRGDLLVADAFDPLGSRKTAVDIEAYIRSLMP
jgi:hypothetical protein